MWLTMPVTIALMVIHEKSPLVHSPTLTLSSRSHALPLGFSPKPPSAKGQSARVPSDQTDAPLLTNT